MADATAAKLATGAKAAKAATGATAASGAAGATGATAATGATLAAATASAALAAEGSVGLHVPGFCPRPQQQVMAAAIAETLAEPAAVLLVEAATGVGKTFAYLVPALLSGRKVLLSTGTKTLQDQLFGKDLPVVSKALNCKPEIALLKGRANYVCRYRLELAEQDSALRGGKNYAALTALRRFARVSRSGDLTQSGILAEDAPLWSQVTSTADNCLGAECPFLSECFVVKARRRAQDAQIVVVNHHLLLADLALKDSGFGELLPEFEGVIVDEAHQLPELAGAFFGLDVSTRSLRDLLRDLDHEIRNEAVELAGLREPAGALDAAVQDLLQCSEAWPARSAWAEVGAVGMAAGAVQNVTECMQTLAAALGEVSARSPGLEQARLRGSLLASRLETWAAPDPETVAWVERFRQSLILHRTPLDASQPLAERRRRHPASWIFTSATLAVGEDFSHAARRLGLPEEVRAESLDSPFDFPQQACLVLPRTPLMNPNFDGYTAACIEWAWPLLEGNPGGGFFLFTSHRALRLAAQLLRQRWGASRVVLVQGELSRAELLAQFRAAENAWLLGAQSFWEGVDVRGDTLSIVIIDRLPFAVPNDPVLQARAAALTAEGGNPFMQMQLPQAVLALKQGVGRLIRDRQDTGILALCDPRLTQKSYGRQFLSSLPPFHRTDDPVVALEFLAAARQARSAPSVSAG